MLQPDGNFLLEAERCRQDYESNRPLGPTSGTPYWQPRLELEYHGVGPTDEQADLDGSGQAGAREIVVSG
jgi:hypothetical protein